MIFSTEITIPASTLPSAPEDTILRLSSGYVTHVWVRWQYGIGDESGLRVFYQEFQLWPLSLGEWFPGSAGSLDFEDWKEIRPDPGTLKIQGYNEADEYDQVVWFAVNVLRPTLSQRSHELVQYLLSEAKYTNG